MNNIGKLPPQAIDLEEAVIGSMLIDKNCIDDIMIILHPECFYKESNQNIYKAIKGLYDDSENIDMLTVMQRLTKNNDLEAIGGAYRLTELTQSIGSTYNVTTHAKIVFEKYIARELISSANDNINLAYNDSNDIMDVLNRANNTLDRINDLLSNKKRTKTFIENIEDSITGLEKRHENYSNNVITGIQTPLAELNKLTNGWQKTDLIVIAARPGMGKTSFVLACLREAASKGYKPAIFSLEMSSVKLTDRLVCAEADIPSDRYRSGNLEDYEWERLRQARQKLDKLDIYIDDEAGADINYIKSKARTLKRKGQCDMIIIDYMQLMGGEKGVNREQQISEISRKSKLMAKELEIPVFQLSQLNRSVETRGGNKKPMLSDLRESGSIEQDADMVIFIYRPEYYGIMEDDESNSTKGVGVLIIAKNREGSTGEILYRYNKSITRYSDYNPDSQFNAVDFPVISNEEPF